MKIYTYRLAGEETRTHFLETEDDLDAYYAWLATAPPVLGADIEATGLKVFARGYAVRLFQVGDAYDAWVLQADRFKGAIVETLADERRRFAFHNGFGYDLPALAYHGFADLESLAPRIIDTRILAHLIDPRPVYQGGQGLSLKQLGDLLVDETAPDTAEDLHKIFREEYGATKKSGAGWRLIDVDHPVYVQYAGLDALLVYRILGELSPTVRAMGSGQLAKREHDLAIVVAREHMKGLRVDVEYTKTLVERLNREEEENQRRAKRYGVENVNSPKQVREGLLAMGEAWTEKTDSGELSTAGDVLRPMADLDRNWDRVQYRDPNPLADAVLRAKRAGKWREAYAEAFLRDRDANDRIHPNISTLQARTARMSVSGPPLQQLPAGDWTIRRCIIADPGMHMISADYKQIEFRVIAANADVKRMKEAIAADRSIHEFTAELLFGPDYPKWKYKVSKNTGFSKAYGGGIARIAFTSGVPFEEAKKVVDAYNQTFPEIDRYSRQLQRKAQYGAKEVITPSGRHLPLDGHRLYAALNYETQSTARDVLAGGMLRVDKAGLGHHVLLPIHDELLGQAPIDEAEETIREISRLMETTYRGVHLGADYEVLGPSWGHGKDYGMPAEMRGGE